MGFFSCMSYTPKDVSFFSCRMEERSVRRNDKNVPAIGKISTYDEWNFLFSKLFDGNLEGVGFAF